MSGWLHLCGHAAGFMSLIVLALLLQGLTAALALQQRALRPLRRAAAIQRPVVLPTLPLAASTNSASSISSSAPGNSSTAPSSNATSSSAERMREIIEPLLDYGLLKQVLDAWSQPLPPDYFGRPLILAGPSGVGKGRLVRALLKDYSKFFKKVVTYTTRGPRADETPGESYHFVSNGTFHAMVANGTFLEWARVHNNFYGVSMSSWQEAQQREKICVFEIDVQGTRTLRGVSRSVGMRPRCVFVSPPGLGVLLERLQERGSETPEEIALRVQTAQAELDFVRGEGRKLFDRVLVNEDFELTRNAFFRLLRDWYPALPSAARLRMLQRRLKNVRRELQERGAGEGAGEGAPAA